MKIFKSSLKNLGASFVTDIISSHVHMNDFLKLFMVSLYYFISEMLFFFNCETSYNTDSLPS